MSTHGSVAKSVRQSKEAHPEQFCPVPRCLWRTGGKFGTPCRKHPAESEAQRVERNARIAAAAAKLPDAPQDVQDAFAALVRK